MAAAAPGVARRGDGIRVSYDHDVALGLVTLAIVIGDDRYEASDSPEFGRSVCKTRQISSPRRTGHMRQTSSRSVMQSVDEDVYQAVLRRVWGHILDTLSGRQMITLQECGLLPAGSAPPASLATVTEPAANVPRSALVALSGGAGSAATEPVAGDLVS